MSATIVSSGQNGSGIVLRSGDQLIVLPGGTAAGVVNSGGTVIATGAVVVSGGALVSSAGGVLSGAAVNGGGRELVLQAGQVAGASIGSGGQESVFSGGYSSAATVRSGGVQSVQSGGFATGAIVQTGGSIAVSSGGMVSGAALSGGTLTVSGAGASAAGVVASGGATVFVQAGATTTGLLALPGSTLLVQAGGTVSGGQIGGTGLIAGGTVTASVLYGANIQVLNGGMVQSGTLRGSVTVRTGGSLIGGSVSEGDVTIASGGFASALNVSWSRYSTGNLTVSSGGLARDIVTSTAMIVDGGTSERTRTDEFGGSETVKAGGRAIGTHGAQYVSSGGVAIGTQTGAYSASQYVLSGGVASATDSRYGYQIIEAGGIAYDTIVGKADFQSFYPVPRQSVSSGGAAFGTVISLGGVQQLALGSIASGTVLLPGGRIQLTSASWFPGGHADYDVVSHTLSVSEGGYARSLTMAGDYTDEYFHLADDGAGGTFITVDGTPCYCHGTAILTDRGNVAVERLAIGDVVITAGGTPRPIRWLGRRSYAPRFAVGNADVLPVLIRAGALGGGLPRRDLRVSPLHAMAIDGVLVPAGALVNGVTILQPPRPDSIDYVHIELDSHDLVLAEGAPSETFVEDDSRAMFHNAAEYRILYPHAASPPPRYCLPRVEHGARLAALRRRLAA